MSRVFQIVVFSNVWVSLASTAAAIITLLKLQIPLSDNTLLLLFVFLSTLFIYIFQRLWRIDMNGNELNPRLKWIREHFQLLRVIAVISFVMVIFIAFQFTWQVLVMLSFAGMISVFYVLKIFNVGGRKVMLRQFPFIKIFVVSAIWVMITVVLPLMLNPAYQLTTSEFTFLCIERFLFIFAITLPFDIRDIEYDKNDSLRTLTGILGIKKTKYLCVSILIFLTLSQFYFSTNVNFKNSGQAVAMSMSYLITSLIILASNKKRKELFYSGLVESTVMIQLLLVGVHLMIA